MADMLTQIKDKSERNTCKQTSNRVRNQEIVEKVIFEMKERINEPLTLHDFASKAMYSIYHFDRIFCDITGVPPRQFLAALRLEHSRRLLLTTSLSVTEVCIRVGYNSLTTFTKRFTDFFGLSPKRMRDMVKNKRNSIQSVLDQKQITVLNCNNENTISGKVIISDNVQYVIFVGLFTTAVPQGCPVACSILRKSGSYHFQPVPEGTYYLFVAAIPESELERSYIPPQLFLVGGGTPVHVVGQIPMKLDPIQLRPIKVTDPPILMDFNVILRNMVSTKVL